eukprot:Stramenopile-MAST_4_protein_4211
MSADGTKLAAVPLYGNIWTSSNSGANWTEVTVGDGPKGWQGAITMSADGTKLAVGANQGNIWTSSNSGATWAEATVGDGTNMWRGIAMSADGAKLAAGVSGGNIWTYEEERPTIVAAPGARHFHVSSAAHVLTLKWLLLRGGDVSSNGNANSGGGGSVRMFNGMLHATNCIFRDNHAFVGGALYIRENASATLENTSFINNSAVYGGGAARIHTSGSTVRFFDSILRNNSCGVVGGGMDVSGSNIVMDRTVLEHNVVRSRASAPYFSGGSVGGGGGGIAVQGDGPGIGNCAWISSVEGNAGNREAFFYPVENALKSGGHPAMWRHGSPDSNLLFQCQVLPARVRTVTVSLPSSASCSNAGGAHTQPSCTNIVLRGADESTVWTSNGVCVSAGGTSTFVVDSDAPAYFIAVSFSVTSKACDDYVAGISYLTLTKEQTVSTLRIDNSAFVQNRAHNFIGHQIMAYAGNITMLSSHVTFDNINQTSPSMLPLNVGLSSTDNWEYDARSKTVTTTGNYSTTLFELDQYFKTRITFSQCCDSDRAHVGLQSAPTTPYANKHGGTSANGNGVPYQYPWPQENEEVHVIEIDIRNTQLVFDGTPEPLGWGSYSGAQLAPYGAPLFFGVWSSTSGPETALQFISVEIMYDYDNNIWGEMATCPQGTYITAGECVQWTVCFPGTYVSKRGSVWTNQACELCPSGRFSNETNPDICSICDAGKWQNDSGSTRCTNCSTGKYLSDFGTPTLHNSESDCHGCSGGKWSNVVGADLCAHECGLGRYGNISGQAAATTACPGACPAGKYGLGIGQLTEEAACEICDTNTFQNETGKATCRACSSGRYTRQRSPNSGDHDDEQDDCVPPPEVTAVFPNTNASTLGNSTMSFYGQHFFDGTIVITTNGKLWSTPVFKNTTWITAESPSGTGRNHPVHISIDGIASMANHALFSYRPPNITALESPPFRGGTIVISGTNFGAETDNITVVVDGSGCGTIPCTDPRLINGNLQCHFASVGREDESRGVVVIVSKQASSRVEFRYAADKGQMTGLPNGVQQITEQGNVSYSVGLTLTPKAEVTVQIVVLSSTSACLVAHPTLQFSSGENGTKPFTVQTIGNIIDEGTNAVAYTCTIRADVSSSTIDNQYRASPPHEFTLNIVNDDEADVKLWTIDATSGASEYDVKFLNFYLQEKSSATYRIGLQTETVKDVLVRTNMSLKNAATILPPHPVLVVSPEYVLFTSSNWTRRPDISLYYATDEIDHDIQQFTIVHDIVTSDAVLFEKATRKSIVVVVDVQSDDIAGLAISANSMVLQQGGASKEILLSKLTSQPLKDVYIHVDIPPSSAIELVNNVSPIHVTKASWTQVDIPIQLQAGIDAPAGNVEVRLRTTSVDPKYNANSTILNVAVTSLLRRLDIIREATVAEGHTYTYFAKLTSPLAAGSSVTLTLFPSPGCIVYSDRSVQFTAQNATTNVPMTIAAADNFVDEGGLNTIAFTCTVVHVLNSTDSQNVYNGQVTPLVVSVRNDDLADIKLQAYSPETKLYEDKLKLLGPLCLEEGKNATYGIVLNSQPSRGVVRVFAQVHMSRVMSPLLLRVVPSTLVFDATNWNVSRPVSVVSRHDSIDNDVVVESVRVHHWLETDDTVFQTTATNMTTKLQVTDDVRDVAGLDMDPAAGVLTVQEGDDVEVRLIRFRTRPRQKVNVTASLVGV